MVMSAGQRTYLINRKDEVNAADGNLERSSEGGDRLVRDYEDDEENQGPKLKVKRPKSKIRKQQPTIETKLKKNVSIKYNYGDERSDEHLTRI